MPSAFEVELQPPRAAAATTVSAAAAIAREEPIEEGLLKEPPPALGKMKPEWLAHLKARANGSGGLSGSQAVEQQEDHPDGDGAVGDVEHPGEMQARNVDEVGHRAEPRPVDGVADRAAYHQAERGQGEGRARAPGPDRQDRRPSQ